MTPITPEELNDLHKSICMEAFTLMQAKNHDYGFDQDALRNFRLAALITGSMTAGILVRLCDKVARLGTFALKGNLSVKSETVRDSIIDAINYLVILAAAIEEERSDSEGTRVESG